MIFYNDICELIINLNLFNLLKQKNKNKLNLFHFDNLNNLKKCEKQVVQEASLTNQTKINSTKFTKNYL